MNPTTRRGFFAATLGMAASVAGCSSTTKPTPNTQAPVWSSAAAPSVPPRPLPTASATERSAILQRFAHESPHAWGLGLPGEIITVPKKGKAIALTFDACGGPGGSGYDSNLISLLRQHNIKATLVLNQRWITANASLASELAQDPLFRIANHGLRHCPLSTNGRSAYGIKGTPNLTVLYDEILGCRDWIQAHQPKTPILFRSGTAFSDDIGVQMCSVMGMPFLGFSVNGDGGATFSKAQVLSALMTVKPGDIVISHMNQPTHDTAAGYREALPRLIAHGFTFTHVS